MSWWQELLIQAGGGVLAGIILERVLKVSERVVKKTSQKTIQKGPLKPHNTIFSLFAWGNNQRAEAEQKSSVGIGEAADALEQPNVSSPTSGGLTTETGFLSSSLCDLLTSHADRLTLQNDLRLVGQYLSQNDHRGVATALYRGLTPVVTALRARQNEQVVNELERDLEKLQKWSNDGSFGEDVPTIISGMERTLHSYFRENR